MEHYNKSRESFSFSSDKEFEEKLLKKLKRSFEGELSESDMLQLNAAKGENNPCICPRWENENQEGYLSCMNCTNASCTDRVLDIN